MGTTLFFSNFCVDSFERAASGFPKKAFYMTIRSHRALSTQKDPFSRKFLFWALFHNVDFRMEGGHQFRKSLYTIQELDVSSQNHKWSRKFTRMRPRTSHLKTPSPFCKVKLNLKTVRIPMQNQKCPK